MDVLRHMPGNLVIGAFVDNIHPVARHPVDKEILERTVDIGSRSGIRPVVLSERICDAEKRLHALRMSGKHTLHQRSKPCLGIRDAALQPSVDIGDIDHAFQLREARRKVFRLSDPPLLR